MFRDCKIIKKREKIDYLKKKKYNFTKKKNKENLSQQKKKTGSNQNDRHENKVVNFSKLKIGKKILKNFKRKIKSPIMKNFLFKTILLRLRNFVGDNSKFKNFFFFEPELFWSGVFIEKFFLLFFENKFFFLEFDDNKGLFFFNLSSYLGREGDKSIEFKEENLQFINIFFSRGVIILKKKSVIIKLIYYFHNYYLEKKTIKLIIAHWMNFRKLFRYRKISKTPFLVFYNNKINIFGKKGRQY